VKIELYVNKLTCEEGFIFGQSGS